MTQVKSKSVFETLAAINVYDYIDKRGGLSYVSWANAWMLLKREFPTATRTIYEHDHTGMNYFSDGRTCYVKVGVTINKQEIIDMLPVMDFRNKSISVDSVTSMDVNKAIQRSTVKCIAMHGLGIGVYTGEDIPEPTPVPVELETMSPKSSSWGAVEKFIVTSRHEEFDTLVQRMSAKYKFTAPSIKKLQGVYDVANEEKQA
tara:strand:- start:12182 stop:12787 length:606 start_codon:yes stop_codon:yes gene_type:complete